MDVLRQIERAGRMTLAFAANDFIRQFVRTSLFITYWLHFNKGLGYSTGIFGFMVFFTSRYLIVQLYLRNVLHRMDVGAQEVEHEFG